MAVYTQVNASELNAFLDQYDLGAVRVFKGIAEGTENSNFLLETTSGTYILTLFEKRVRQQDIPYFLAITRHLASAGFPAARPIPDKRSCVLNTLNSRPATICSFLPGVSFDNPDADACHTIGSTLAQLHSTLADFPLKRENDLSLSAWPRLFAGLETCAEMLRTGLSDTIACDLEQLTANWPDNLPAGTIHADLFPDNALFAENRLSGVIDFYFACTDMLAYDIAVCLNSWCFTPDGASLVAEKTRALVDGYHSIRPLSASEINALPIFARGAAMRFFLTRLVDCAQRGNSQNSATVKNPLDFARRLDVFRNTRTLDECLGITRPNIAGTRTPN